MKENRRGMTDKRIKSYLEGRLKRLESIRNKRKWTTAELGDAVCCKKTLAFIDSLQEEPEELEQAAVEAFKEIVDDGRNSFLEIFKAGAKWQKENLWKPADGDDLPEIDREVIALLDSGKVVFAHRPPEYWDGKNIVTGKVTRNYPKTYDKGGWNIPNINWWLDCLLPNMED